MVKPDRRMGQVAQEASLAWRFWRGIPGPFTQVGLMPSVYISEGDVLPADTSVMGHQE